MNASILCSNASPLYKEYIPGFGQMFECFWSENLDFNGEKMAAEKFKAASER